MTVEENARIAKIENVVNGLISIQACWLDEMIKTGQTHLSLMEAVAGVKSYFNSVMLLLLPKIPGLDDGVHKEISSFINRVDFDQDQWNAGLEIVKSRIKECEAATAKARAMLHNFRVSSQSPVPPSSSVDDRPPG
jgi:hypothetical protein